MGQARDGGGRSPTFWIACTHSGGTQGQQQEAEHEHRMDHHLSWMNDLGDQGSPLGLVWFRFTIC